MQRLAGKESNYEFIGVSEKERSVRMEAITIIEKTIFWCEKFSIYAEKKGYFLKEVQIHNGSVLNYRDFDG